MNTTVKPVLGDWVQTQYGQKGRVTAIHRGCPEDAVWIAGQQIPVTQEQIDGDWLSVLLHQGGSVIQPIDTISILDQHPGTLINLWADRYFRETPA